MKRFLYGAAGIMGLALVAMVALPGPRAVAQGVLALALEKPGNPVPTHVFLNGATDGTNAVALATGSAANQAAAITGNKALLTDIPGQWTVTANPVAATQATATKAAGAAGVRHVVDCVTIGLVAVGAQAAPVVYNLRDGATGAGTILWSVALIGAAATPQPPVALCGLQIAGTAATAMTLESAAAPAASNFAFATLQGHDAN